MIESIVKKAAPPKAQSAKGKKAAAEIERIRAIFARFAAKDPHPKGELDYVNPFTLLVAVVLSAQATDAGVNKATRAAVRGRRHAAARCWRSARSGVREHIRTIGLFRNKAKNVIALSRRS